MNFQASKHTISLVVTTLVILHVLGNLHDFVIMSLLWPVLLIFMVLVQVPIISWDFNSRLTRRRLDNRYVSFDVRLLEVKPRDHVALLCGASFGHPGYVTR